MLTAARISRQHFVTNMLFLQFDDIIIEDLMTAFNFDGLETSHPIYVPVYHPDEINEIFDKISYSKVSVSVDVPIYLCVIISLCYSCNILFYIFSVPTDNLSI